MRSCVSASIYMWFLRTFVHILTSKMSRRWWINARETISKLHFTVWNTSHNIICRISRLPSLQKSVVSEVMQGESLLCFGGWGWGWIIFLILQFAQLCNSKVIYFDVPKWNWWMQDQYQFRSSGIYPSKIPGNESICSECGVHWTKTKSVSGRQCVWLY